MNRYSRKGKGNLFDGGDFIKEVLIRKHLTNKEVAMRCGISAPRFSNILNGWERPRKAELHKLIVVLDLDVAAWRRDSKYVREELTYGDDDDEIL